MITRTHTKGDAPSTAVYSDCERYRYSLTRVWNDQAGKVLFVMLNPSTATEVQNDPTVERCERRARTLGFGGRRLLEPQRRRPRVPSALRKHLARPTIVPHHRPTVPIQPHYLRLLPVRRVPLPRRLRPPTATGFPASSGWSRTSVAA